MAWAPYEDDWPMVSTATIAQTVKKIMSNRNSDFLSLRFSATSPATAADSPIQTLPGFNPPELHGYTLSAAGPFYDAGLRFATIRDPRRTAVKARAYIRGRNQWRPRPSAKCPQAASPS